MLTPFYTVQIINSSLEVNIHNALRAYDADSNPDGWDTSTVNNPTYVQNGHAGIQVLVVYGIHHGTGEQITWSTQNWSDIYKLFEESGLKIAYADFDNKLSNKFDNGFWEFRIFTGVGWHGYDDKAVQASVYFLVDSDAVLVEETYDDAHWYYARALLAAKEVHDKHVDCTISHTRRLKDLDLRVRHFNTLMSCLKYHHEHYSCMTDTELLSFKQKLSQLAYDCMNI
jgi:hypothetical protein